MGSLFHLNFVIKIPVEIQGIFCIKKESLVSITSSKESSPGPCSRKNITHRADFRYKKRALPHRNFWHGHQHYNWRLQPRSGRFLD